MVRYFNRRIKLFTIWDIKLSQIAAMCIMIILIKLIPEITSLNFIWYILIAFICALRPLYVMFFKQE
ncbi:MAG: hypothetical protein APR54_09705 [Candidatus Cloacimonas sp. SDB]|nr:MAG: hypothetical protein APR54_09705 [Candidatus Cloacimonas sp. SDB]